MQSLSPYRHSNLAASLPPPGSALVRADYLGKYVAASGHMIGHTPNT